MFCWLTMFREFGFFLMLSSLFNAVAAFNVDLSKPVIFNGVNQSMFGFTVAAYKENGKSWVLVGAPKNRDEYFSKKHRTNSYPGYNGTYKGGSLYSCDVTSDEQGACSLVKFPNISESESKRDENYIEQQGLGASLATSGSDGVVMVCAPRVYNANIRDTQPFGTCYYSKKGIHNFTKYSLRNARGNEQINREAGFSAAISKDSETFYSGAVGTMGDKGYFFGLTLDQNNTVQSKKNNVYNDASTLSYLGYSLTSLDFYGMKEKGVAVALPRVNHLQGQVTIFTTTLSIKDSKTLDGKQLGAYFGYSICTSDIDGDGADDLIIGAPLYSDRNNPSNQIYDHGRIFVYYQEKASCNQNQPTCWKNRFKKFDSVDGEHSKGYFGFAIASLGDINRDGFGDIVVGAPYEEWYENCPKDLCTGAVYIYHGSSKGIVKKYSQIIRASDIYHLRLLQKLPLISFGSSLSGGLDLDGNSYPDLVVGALESDVVFLFKSKPVINLTTIVSFSKSSIALDEYSCKLKDQTEVICVDLIICLQYDGKDVETQTEVSVNITLDHGKLIQDKRMFFYNNEEEKKYHREISLPLNKNIKKCQNMTTYVACLRPNQDKLSSMEVQINSSLATSTNKDKNGRPSGALNNGPVLLTKGNLHIKNNCGEDNKCIPHLSISMKSNLENFILRADSKNNLDLNVSVMNQGEDAYNSIFKLKVPGGLSYSNVKDVSSFENVSTICLPPTRDNGFAIECNIGNPLPAGETVDFTVTFEADGKPVEDSQFKFLATVNYINLELNEDAVHDSTVWLNITVTEAPNIFITGVSTPHEVYNISGYNSKTTDSDGPIVLHEYRIQNLGLSEISEAVAMFYWPLKLSSGENLLYLISDPVTKGSVFCNRLDNFSVGNEYSKMNYSYEYLIKMDDDGDFNSSLTKDEIIDRVENVETVETANKTYYGFGFCNETATNSSEYSYYCNKERTKFVHRWGNVSGTIDPAVDGTSVWAIGNKTSKANLNGTNKRGKRSNPEITADIPDTFGPSTIYPDPPLDEPSKEMLWNSISPTNFVCSMGKCVRIRCEIKNLRKTQAVSVIFPSVVWAKTIQKMNRQWVARVGSYVEVNVTKLASKIELEHTPISHQVFTNIKTLDLNSTVPLWIIVGSAWIGVLLLMGIVYVMYKVGFFKRNLPDSQALQNDLALQNFEK